jgi:NAD(P)-dependent dehydrogenase (short-subunit alcohol dehydrogenase family)/uncharacterized OB-fold protein
LGLTAAAALGHFELQVCRQCATVQYPPREACHRCLSVQLDWKPQSGAGELISETNLFHSNEAFFRARLPWRLGMIRLDCGPIVIAHVHGAVPAAKARVRVDARLDKAGRAALIALPEQEVSGMAEDTRLSEMTCDPKSRKVLVTNAETAVGQALVRSLLAAGAGKVWAGYVASEGKAPALEGLERLDRVMTVQLDVTHAESVKAAAAKIGTEVDILINSAECHEAFGISTRNAVDHARAEMDVNYFGLLRLAQEFGAAMRARGADHQSSAMAWVNLLSVYALSSCPSHGTFSASKAAAFSLSQCLRAQMQPAGVRVINVFPGPVDDESNQAIPPPKLRPEALARAIVQSLQNGAEDVYPGDVAQEWLARWRENPKVLEYELATGR